MRAMQVMAELGDELLARDDFETVLTHVKVAPLQWGPEAPRRIISRALVSNVSDADMAAAAEQAVVEVARAAEAQAAAREKMRRGRRGSSGAATAANSTLLVGDGNSDGAAAPPGDGGRQPSGSAAGGPLSTALGPAAVATTGIFAGGGGGDGAYADSGGSAPLLPGEVGDLFETDYMDVMMEMHLLVPGGSDDDGQSSVTPQPQSTVNPRGDDGR